MQDRITIKTFEELTPIELYSIIQLRNAVFVVEQNCVFQDADNKDQNSFHLMIYRNDNLAAYCRLLPPQLAYDEMSIGRVVSSPTVRRTGVGRELIEKGISMCYEKFGKGAIRIGAQLYLTKFYGSFGFIEDGDVYLEDGIEHIEMVKIMDN